MDQLLAYIGSIPYLPQIAAVLGLWFVYKIVAQNFDLGSLFGARRGPGSGLSKARLEREALARLRKGDYVGAGRAYEEAELLPQAAEAFLQGGEYYLAATIRERQGALEDAGELYTRAGDYKKAADVFVASGHALRAAELYQEKGNNLEAARYYTMASQWRKAAELYVRSGYPMRAAEAYEKMGRFRDAAEAYERHFVENVSYAPGYTSAAPKGERRSALLAGQLFEKAGDLPRAQAIYVRGAYFREAAQASMKLSEFRKAAEYYLRAEDPLSAAEAYEKNGDLKDGALLRGDVAYKNERLAEAAAYFQKGGDAQRAAELFESISMFDRAGAAYESADSFASAGAAYLRGGLKERAARAYERAGEDQTAAQIYEEMGQKHKATELFERAGQTFRSAQSAAERGDFDHAVELLQRVAATDEEYLPASALLAQIFVETGRPSLAEERLRRVIGDGAVSRANLDLHYWYGRARELDGDAAGARAIYQKVLAEDLKFRDAAARLDALAQPGAKEVAAPAPSTPTPSEPPGTGPIDVSALGALRFAPKDEIGRGPLGIVFKAADRHVGRDVALRVVKAELVQDRLVRESVTREIDAASKVAHPNYVETYGAFAIDEKLCVASELVPDGRTFADPLRSGQRMPYGKALFVARALVPALGYVHERGFVHGSVQPSNIMMMRGVIKLADLGLGSLARKAPVSGVDYRPPDGSTDSASDLYGLAAVLYHLLTGVHPKSQAQGVALPLPSHFARGVPEAFDRLVVRALHPERRYRFSSAAEFSEHLRSVPDAS